MKSHRSFTLIELVVVIAVIVILVSLTIYAAAAIQQRSEIGRTHDTLGLLAQAIRQWESERQGQVTFRASYDLPAPGAVVTFDVVGDASLPETEEQQFTSQLFEIVSKLESVKGIIAQINPKRIKRDATDRLQFFDEWDRQILAIPPGRRRMLQDMQIDFPLDPDESIRIVSFEHMYGIAANNQIYLLSAGPDGKYGNLRLDTDLASLNPTELSEADQAKDNLYQPTPDFLRGPP